MIWIQRLCRRLLNRPAKLNDDEDEEGGFVISFTDKGVVHFDKYTVADYVKSLNGMVKRLKDSQEDLRQIEIRINCIRNEIENISPKSG